MKTWIKNLLKVRDTPEALARGLAVGFFFGVSFFWGFQIVLAVLVSFLIRGNKVVAAAMTAVSNPLTSLPIYSFCYFVGHLLIGGRDRIPDFSVVHSVEGFLKIGPHFFITMLVGTTVVGLVGALLIYASSERLLQALRGRMHRKAL
ncbi:MAG: DUF2062 domain-containing protein [Deltaproteobacteria bacterium]|nr:DUF2062 domain-containing protein [Deltaproteobacteria bacterium]